MLDLLDLETNLQIEDAKANVLKDGLSLYLHIPFCQTRCSYCDFNTYTNLSHLYGRYTGALRREIERTLAAVQRGDYNPLAPLPVLAKLDINLAKGQKIPLNTVFFGGGTPSLLPSPELARIFQQFRIGPKLGLKPKSHWKLTLVRCLWKNCRIYAIWASTASVLGCKLLTTRCYAVWVALTTRQAQLERWNWRERRVLIT